MTQEETQVIKELLLKDLCARLPYGVMGQCEIDASYDTPFDTISQTHRFNAVVDGIIEDSLIVSPSIEDQDELEFANEEIADGVDILDFKSYLFPLSSMAEEQKRELNKKFNVQFSGNDIHSIHYHFEGCWDTDLELDLQDWLWFINWCYKNHFDVNNLIEKGLAIDATGLNVY